MAGSAITLLGTWLNRRAEHRARLQDRQFKIEDRESERLLALKAAEAEEDKYWFDRRLEFFQIQSKIMLACKRDELAAAIGEFQAFLERVPACHMNLKNISFVNRYLTTKAIEELLTGVDSDVHHPFLGDFVNGMMHDFEVPTGSQVREYRD